MSFILLGILNSQVSGAGITGWINLTVTTTNKAMSNDGTNLYVAGNSGYFYKLDGDGISSWQRRLGTSTWTGIDSSASNTYITGYSSSIYLAKYSAAGTIAWQRNLNSGTGDEVEDVFVDSSENTYIAGLTNNNTYKRALIAAYNSSGTLQWQRKLTPGTYDEIRYYCIGGLADGTTYVGGQNQASGRGLFVKYAANGSLQFQKEFTTATDVRVYGIATDSSGNVYLTGFYSSSGYKTWVAKINSSGVIQWQKHMVGAGSFPSGYEIVLDADNNVYCVGNDGAGKVQILAFDNSGNTLWQRTIARSGQSLSSTSASIVGSSLSVGFTDSGATSFNVPLDGSLTGSYVISGRTYVYAESSNTIANGVAVIQNSSHTDSAASLSSSTSGLSASTPTLTSTTVTIP